MDFFNGYRIVADGSPYLSSGGDFDRMQRAHLPFTQFIQYIFSFSTPIISFSIFLAVFVFFLVWCCYKNLRTQNGIETVRNVVVFSLLTYPFLIEIDRAHIEAITFIFFYLFVHFYQKEKFSISSFFLACTIAMKPYSLVFVPLLAFDRKFKEIGITLAYTAALTAVSLMVFKGGAVENLRNMLANISLNYNIYTVGNEGLYFGHSLFGLFKVFIVPDFLFDAKGYYSFITTFSRIYFYAAAAIFLLLSYYVFLEKEFWKRVTLLTFAMLILPYNSPDMRLLHLYVPLFLFINKDRHDPYDSLYAVLLALLFVPKDYWHYAPIPEISSSIVATPIIIVVISLLIIVRGIKSRSLLREDAPATRY